LLFTLYGTVQANQVIYPNSIHITHPSSSPPRSLLMRRCLASRTSSLPCNHSPATYRFPPDYRQAADSRVVSTCHGPAQAYGDGNMEHSPSPTSSNIRKVRSKSYRLRLLLQRIFGQDAVRLCCYEKLHFHSGIQYALGARLT